MPEIFQKPECPCRTYARLVIVHDNGHVIGNAARRKQMFDDPEKRLQRRVIGVDEADAEEIEMHGAGQVAVGEVFGRPQVDDERLVP